MPNRYPRNIVERLHKALAAWRKIDPALQAGPFSLADLEATITQSEQIKSEIRALETQLVDLRNRRDALYVTGWEQVKRLRGWVKAVYGDDSSAYELAGGTRLSERKPRARRKPQTGAVRENA